MRAIIAFLFLITALVGACSRNTPFYDQKADAYWHVKGMARGSQPATCFIESTMTDGSYVQIHRSLTDGEVWVAVHDVLWHIDPKQTGKLRWNVVIGDKSVSADFNYSANNANSISIQKIMEEGFFDTLRDADRFTIEMPNNIKSISFGFKNKGQPVFDMLADCVSKNEATYRDASTQAPTHANTASSGNGSERIESKLNPAEKRLIQEGLVMFGDYDGLTDGVFGDTTRQAIAKFQTQTGEKRPATGELTSTDVRELATTALDVRKSLGWRPLKDSRTGITLSYPAVFLTKRADSDMGGETLDSRDGALSLQTIRIPYAEADGIKTLFQRLRQRQDTEITYQLLRPNYFIITGKMKDFRFYARAEQRGDEIRGFDYLWKENKNAQNAQISERISQLMASSFFPFDGDPTAGPESNYYPTITAMVNAAGGDATAPGNTHTDTTTANTSGPASSGGGAMKDITVRLKDAMPPPANGALTTSDGQGLRFTYHYTVPEKQELAPYYHWAVDTNLLTTLPEINMLDGMFLTPRPLHYATGQCGAVNAFYAKKDTLIVLCYELIDHLLNVGSALSKGMSDPRAFQTEFVRDTIRFALLHETGHALIDLLDLPTVGREEDSVDQLATILLIMGNGLPGEKANDKARVLQLASIWFKVIGAQQSLNDDTFADEHSLSAQRYYDILCIAYGLDTQQYAPLVSKGLLPKERAAGCVNEATRVRDAWVRLLVEHISPHTKADAQKADQRRKERESRNPLEWDRNSNPFGH